MSIGIYKIKSPSNRIYIGQSCRVETRFEYYKRLDCKQQTRLYASLIKYGVENHKFEIIEECEIDNLNERERYWQDYYDVLGKKGLNCRLTASIDKSGKQSKETKEKISKANTGKKRSDSTREVLRNYVSNGVTGMLGKKHTEETKKKISKSHKRPMLGKTHSDEYKNWLKENYSKLILDKNTGVFYLGAKEVCDLYGFNVSTFRSKLNGHKKNNTQFIHV